ncbi:hypothetical protein F5148DRAFT_112261 [Russula earlei]|uniref:Uncharacterized protein n=1 Tax=Russula earlei TaxID=71964 RepID=A0ACC0U711_9AGAM|nr:hypothetical protein F5148DRAFT_112261 [Russula earlei]
MRFNPRHFTYPLFYLTRPLGTPNRDSNPYRGYSLPPTSLHRRGYHHHHHHQVSSDRNVPFPESVHFRANATRKEGQFNAYLIAPPMCSAYSFQGYGPFLFPCAFFNHPLAHEPPTSRAETWSDAVSPPPPSLGMSSSDAPPSPSVGTSVGPFHPTWFTRPARSSVRTAYVSAYPTLVCAWPESKLSSSTSCLFPRHRSERSPASLHSNLSFVCPLVQIHPIIQGHCLTTSSTKLFPS